MKIAIDGPSGAGKSTVAKALAQKLNILYLDTGAFYRTIALKAHQEGFDFAKNPLQNLIERTNITVKHIGGTQKTFLDGTDVSEKIREHHISKLASDISAYPEVRLFMVKLQREIAAKQDCILDGRDIGTYVLPDAEFKFFLSASIDERASRRYLELSAKNAECNLEQIKEDIAQRDYNDMHRDFAPLKRAEDAIEIDSTSMTPNEVVKKMLNIINKG